MIYIYTRVSTQGQAEKGDSIEGQIKKCQAWAVMEDLEDETEVIEEKAVSGGVPLKERPQGKKVFEKLKDGDFLICYKLDRLFRNSLDALQTTEALVDMGVGLVLLDIAHKDITRDAVGKLILSILSAVAEMEKERIKDRMMDGKEIKRAKGFWMGGHTPFGYDREKTEKGTKLVECPKNMPIRKEIIGMYENGLSPRKIAKGFKQISASTIGRIINQHKLDKMED